MDAKESAVAALFIRKAKCREARDRLDLARTQHAERDTIAHQRAAMAEHARQAALAADEATAAALSRAATDAASVATATAARARDAHERVTRLEAELAEAESHVRECAETVVDLERDALVTEANAAWEHFVSLANRLRGLLPDALNTPINQQRTVPGELARILERVDHARDDLNTPIPILKMGHPSNGRRARRLAELIGDGIAA